MVNIRSSSLINPLLTVTVYQVAHSVCRNLAFYLPRNANLDQVGSSLPLLLAPWLASG